MVMGAHWANKVGPPRVMTGFARGPALIAFYLFLISPVHHTETRTWTDGQTGGQTYRRRAHPGPRAHRAGCLRCDSL